MPAEPKKFSQSFVPLLSGIREAQQENGNFSCGLHRFPVDQLAGFGSHLPMNVVQTVAGAVKPQIMVFRKSAAGFWVPLPGREGTLDIRDLCGNRYRFNKKSGCQLFADRQAEKSQIVIYKAALQLYVPDATVLRCPLLIWQEGDFLSGDLLLQAESVFYRWAREIAPGLHREGAAFSQANDARCIQPQLKQGDSRQCYCKRENRKPQYSQKQQPGKPFPIGHIQDQTGGHPRQI